MKLTEYLIGYEKCYDQLSSKIKQLERERDKLIKEREELYEFLNRTDRDLILKIEKLEQQNEEMLNALIKIIKWHYNEFNKNNGCPFDCDGNDDCYECIHLEIASYIKIIEKATGKKWGEICK